MSSELLTVITIADYVQAEPLSVRSPIIPVLRIIGLRLENSASVVLPGDTHGNMTEHQINPGDQFAQRVASFFMRHLAVADPGYYNSDKFVGEVLNLPMDQTDQGPRLRWARSLAREPEDIIAGKPYGILDASNTAVHTMLGIGGQEKGRTLSVLPEGPMVIADAGQLRKARFSRLRELVFEP